MDCRRVVLLTFAVVMLGIRALEQAVDSKETAMMEQLWVTDLQFGVVREQSDGSSGKTRGDLSWPAPYPMGISFTVRSG